MGLRMCGKLLYCNELRRSLDGQWTEGPKNSQRRQPAMNFVSLAQVPRRESIFRPTVIVVKKDRRPHAGQLGSEKDALLSAGGVPLLALRAVHEYDVPLLFKNRRRNATRQRAIVPPAVRQARVVRDWNGLAFQVANLVDPCGMSFENDRSTP